MDPSHKSNLSLAQQARALFTKRVTQVLPELAEAIQNKFSALLELSGNARESQDRRDAWQAFQKNGSAWVAATTAAWTQAQFNVATATSSGFTDSSQFELVRDDVVEDKILASRLALSMLGLASWELNDLRLRVQALETTAELHKRDVFRPEVLAQHMQAQWIEAFLSRPMWLIVQDPMQRIMAEHLLAAYHAVNEFLVQQGVMAEIDLRPLVRRTPAAPVAQDRFGNDQTAIKPAVLGNGSGSLDIGVPQLAPDSHLTKARLRAQGLIDRLKRQLSAITGLDSTKARPVSATLTRALANLQEVEKSKAQRSAVVDALSQLSGGADKQIKSRHSDQVINQKDINQTLGTLREQTSALKQAASSSSEKATIEIVALMFQSILAEDRISAVIRVWFARLQIPVLRVAISEPEFFASLEHPARRLIDRMGSCALGFNATLSGGALESEIKRVVQVVEQYPETGRRVFLMVYAEFEKFLSKFLAQQGSAARVISVAQQVEQKEIMAIQYTIEMRKLLHGIPLPDEIRQFLFKIWAEALAVAAVRNGSQHEETLRLKRAAADLVWSASAKRARSDRARVIADLPRLLQLLRLGMSMLGMTVPERDRQVKLINDTLANALMSKTDLIPSARIEVLAKRLKNLEDYLSDVDVGDLPLDANSLMTMLGMDAANIQVIVEGGSAPTEAMRLRVKELQLGTWFNLDHNRQMSHVQFAWCSEHKQLHLFAAVNGCSFLIQAHRLAAYLHAGLLVPLEDELLTVRATRDALAKIEANPERLLS